MSWSFDDIPMVPISEIPQTESEFKAPHSGGKSIKGQIVLYYTAWCGGDNCSEWEHCEEKSKRGAGIGLRKHGWQLTRYRGWLCPKCSQKS